MIVFIKNTGFKYIVFAIMTIIAPSIANARSCNSDDRDKAHHFSEIAGKKVVDEYGGGRNVNVELVQCEFNNYSKEFRLKVEIYWSGSVFDSEKYNSDGIMKISSNGSRSQYSETYANQNLKDWKGLRTFLGGVNSIMELGALERETNQRLGFPIRFENRCDKTLKLAIRYLKNNDEWETKHWWEFEAGEKSMLLSNGEKIRTNNSIIYFYAQTSDGRIKTSGDFPVKINGKEYKMKKLEDDEGTTDISLACP